MIGDGHPVHGSDGLDRLGDHLEHRVILRAAAVVGIDPGNLLVLFVPSADFRRVVDTANPEYVFDSGAVLLREALEGAADRTIKGFQRKVFDLGLLGEAEGVWMIR